MRWLCFITMRPIPSPLRKLANSKKVLGRCLALLVAASVLLASPPSLRAGFGFGFRKGLGGIINRESQRSPWLDREYRFRKFKITTSDGKEQVLKLAALYDSEGSRFFLAVNTLIARGRGKCKPTFHQIYLEDSSGHRVYPVALIITERWAHIKITITVTRYHYMNGELINTQTSVSSYEYDKFLGRKVGKVLVETREKGPPPIYRILHEKPCGSIRGLISLFPIPPEYVSKIGESTLTVVLSAPPGRPVTSARFSLGAVEKAEEMVNVPVKMVATSTHIPKEAGTAPKKKAEVSEKPSRLLTREREAVEELEGKALVPMGEEDPCSECNRVAEALTGKQKDLSSQLEDLEDRLCTTRAKKKELNERIRGIKEELEYDRKAVEDAKEKLAEIKQKKRRFLESLKDISNSTLGYDGVALGEFGKDIPGFSGTLGWGGGTLRLLEPGQGVHLKNTRAENIFDNLLREYRDPIERLLQREDEVKKQLEEAQERAAQTQKMLESARKARGNLTEKESELQKEIKNTEDAMAELNSLIDRVNRRCEMCERIARKIFAERIPAEKALEEAEKRLHSTEPPDPQRYPEARRDYDAAREVLERAKEMAKLKRFPKARKEAEYAKELLERARADERLTRRIQEMERELTRGREAIRSYRERNDCCRPHTAERAAKDLEKRIARARELLRSHNPLAGLEILSGCPKGIPGMVEPSAKRCLQGKLADTVGRGRGMRIQRARGILDDPEIKQTIKDIKDIFQEGANNLDRFGKYMENFDKWRERAEKAGLLRYVDGRKTPTAILDTLRGALPRIKGHISVAKGRVEQAQKLVEELDRMVSQGTWEYFKEKAGETLKEKAIKLASDLAASGLGCDVAGPLAGIWGEAYGMGRAAGQRIVDLIGEIQAHGLEWSKRYTGLCDSRVDPSEVTIPHGIPVVYDVYIEIFDRCKTPLRARADVTICRSPGCSYRTTLNLVGIEKALGEAESSNMTQLPWRPGDVKVDVTCPNGKKPSEKEVLYHVRRYCEKDRVRVVIDIRVHTRGCRKNPI